MDCTDARELVSAALDDEVAADERRTLDLHVAACSACAAYTTRVAALHRTGRVAEVEAVPDLTESILRAVGSDRVVQRHRERRKQLRLTLGLVALVQFAVALHALVTGDLSAGHLARDLAAFDLAIAVGFAVVAWQPGRAFGLLPTALAIVGAIALVLVLDAAGGATLAGAESVHAPLLVGVAVLWQLSRSEPRSERGATSP